ncbi:MAG: PepSY domain-containing protein [Candidatus Sumerlaeaceae bacterium]
MSKSLTRQLVPLFGAVLLLGGATLISAEEKDDEKVEVNALPAAVRATVEASAPGATIKEAELESEDGKQIYSIEVKDADGKELELEIALDGKLIKIEKEDADEDDDEQNNSEEVRIEPGQAPAAVQAALQKYVKENATSVTLSREKEHGVEAFEVEYLLEDIDHSLKFTAGGDLLEEESKVASEALPADVTNAVLKKFPGAQIKQAEAVTVRFYEIDIIVNGKKQEVKVSPAGTLQSDDDDDEEDDDDDDEDDD